MAKLTKPYSKLYNVLRTKLHDITGELSLYQATSTGYALLATISDGWWPSRETEQPEGAQYMAIYIAQTDRNAAQFDGTVNKSIAAVDFMGLRYKVKNKVDPLEEPRIWILKCDPTGEVVY